MAENKAAKPAVPAVEPAAPTAEKSKRVSVASKDVDTTKKAVTFVFTNGKSVVAALSAMKPDMVTRLALHGLSQKIGDSFATVAKDAVEEGSDPVVLAFMAANAELTKLVNGDWKERSMGGIKYIDLIEPLLLVASKGGKTTTREKVMANLADKTGKELAAVRQSPKVIAAMNELAKGRTESVDVDSLFV